MDLTNREISLLRHRAQLQVTGEAANDHQALEVGVDLDQAGELVHKPVLNVASRSAGFGDHLLGLCFAAGLQRQRKECVVRYCCDPRFHAWLLPFWSELGAYPKPGPVYFLNHDTDHAIFTAAGLARWQYWAQQYSVQPELPELLELTELAVAEAIPYAGRIVLFPSARYSERQWPLAKWVTLSRNLVELGYRVLVMDETPTGALGAFTCDVLCGAQPSTVMAIVKAATCIVANDSGPSHLAGLLRVPCVSILSHASDRAIMGLYPLAHVIGGREVGNDQVGASMVTAAVVSRVRSSLSPWQAVQFRAVLADRDRMSLGWEPIYARLHFALQELLLPLRGSKRLRIVEIGVRAGYSAWTALQAIPGSRVHGIELAAPDREGREVDGGYPFAWQHAQKICGSRLTLQFADSHELEFIPACQLAYVDGDHSRDGCLADLELCHRSNAMKILVDDYANFEAVRAACSEFLTRHPDNVGRFLPSPTGMFLICDRK